MLKVLTISAQCCSKLNVPSFHVWYCCPNIKCRRNWDFIIVCQSLRGTAVVNGSYFARVLRVLFHVYANLYCTVTITVTEHKLLFWHGGHLLCCMKVREENILTSEMPERISSSVLWQPNTTSKNRRRTKYLSSAEVWISCRQKRSKLWISYSYIYSIKWKPMRTKCLRFRLIIIKAATRWHYRYHYYHL